MCLVSKIKRTDPGLRKYSKVLLEHPSPVGNAPLLDRSRKLRQHSERSIVRLTVSKAQGSVLGIADNMPCGRAREPTEPAEENDLSQFYLMSLRPFLALRHEAFWLAN